MIKLYECLDKEINPEKAKRFKKRKLQRNWRELKNKVFYEERTVYKTKSQILLPSVIFPIVFGLFYAWSAWIVEPLIALMPELSQYQEIVRFLLSVAATALLSFGLYKSTKDVPNANKTDSLLSRIFHWIYGLLNGESFTKDTVTTTHSGVMGSIAFEKYLAEMLGIAAGLKKDLKVIVVLDNIDRLSKRRLRSAWDSMQLFANYIHQASG